MAEGVNLRRGQDKSAETGLMFEVINNRGKRLSQLEMVKNYLVYYATRHAVRDLEDDVRRAWPRILDDLRRADMMSNDDEDAFLRHAWIVFKNPNKNESYRVYDGLKSSFPPSSPGSWKGLREFVAFLQIASRSMKRLYSRDGVPVGDESDVLTDLACQTALASVIPLVIAIDARITDTGERLRLLRLVEKLNFRIYGLPIAKRSDSGQGWTFWFANRLWAEWGRPAKEGGVTDGSWLEARLKAFVAERAPDAEVVKALTLDRDEQFDYYGWGALKYFLARWEKALKRADRRSEDLPRLLAAEDPKFRKDFFHREHLWARAEGSVPAEKADYHRRRLANFILLEGPLNESVSNWPIAEKLASYRKDDSERTPILYMVRRLQEQYAAAETVTRASRSRVSPGFWLELYSRLLDAREQELVEFALREWSVDYDGARIHSVVIDSQGGVNEVYRTESSGGQGGPPSAPPGEP